KCRFEGKREKQEPDQCHAERPSEGRTRDAVHPERCPGTTFSLATNRYGQGPDGEKKEYTDYHNVVVWNIGKRNLAEITGQYLHKGSLVYIEGRLQTRSWEGQDGQKRKTTEVNATEVQFLEPRSQSQGQGQGQA